MRLRLLGAVFSAALLVCGVGYAQTSSSSSTSSRRATREKSLTATGKVKSYTPGKSIQITENNGKTKKFNLSGKDVTANVDPSVSVGSEVQVSETMSNGQKTINIEPASAANASGMSGSSEHSRTKQH